MKFSKIHPVVFTAVMPTVLAQTIDFKSVDALPPNTRTMNSAVSSETLSYNPSSASASVAAKISATPIAQPSKRSVDDSEAPYYQLTHKLAARWDGDCSPANQGLGPVPYPDDANTFQNWPDFNNAALNAAVPAGYVNTFTDLRAASQAYGYMGYTSLSTYDVNGCAVRCNNTAGCNAFNIYYERDPTQNIGPNCLSPSSTTFIKCVLFGGPVNTANAQNTGYTDGNFTVAITGSNGYVKSNVQTVPGFSPPDVIGNNAIQAPSDCNGTYDTYMGYTVFNNVPFDPTLCAAACSSASQYNIDHPPSDGTKPRTCQFFNTYILLVNGTSVGQYCTMYTKAWNDTYAINSGQWRGYDHYTIQYSFTYTNATNPGGNYCPPVVSSTSSSITPYATPSTSSTTSSSSISISTSISTSSRSSSSSTSTSSTRSSSTSSTTSASQASPPSYGGKSSSISITSTSTFSYGMTTTTKASSSSTRCTCAASASAVPSNNPSSNSNSYSNSYGYSSSSSSSSSNSPICGTQAINVFGPRIKALSGPSQCPSQNLCAWNCLQTPGCKSFTWCTSSMTCGLYAQAVKDAIWLIKWGNAFTYDSACYDYDCSKGGCGDYGYSTRQPLPLMGQCSSDYQCGSARCLNGVCL